MNTLRLIKSKKPSSTYNIISWIFILSGGKFYLDYLLPTNPTSKNKVIQFIFGWARFAYTGKEPIKRYFMSYTFGGAHFIALILNARNGNLFDLDNILINMYPILVQIWIGYRCWYIKSLKQKSK